MLYLVGLEDLLKEAFGSRGVTTRSFPGRYGLSLWRNWLLCQQNPDSLEVLMPFPSSSWPVSNSFRPASTLSSTRAIMPGSAFSTTINYNFVDSTTSVILVDVHVSDSSSILYLPHGEISGLNLLVRSSAYCMSTTKSSYLRTSS